MNKSVSIVGLCIALMLNSCTSVLDFQTAKTLGEGNNELTIAATSINPQSNEDHTTPYVAPSIEFKRGMHEKWDLGIQSQPFSSATINTKFQFVGDKSSKLAFAATSKLGYDYTISDDLRLSDLKGYSGNISLESLVESLAFLRGTEIDKTSVNYGLLHSEIGLVGSYHFNKEIAVSSGLKAIYLIDSGLGVHTFANTLGVEIGKKTKFSVNFGYNFAWSEGTEQDGFRIGRLQYGLGIKKPINFGANKEAKQEEKKTLN